MTMCQIARKTLGALLLLAVVGALVGAIVHAIGWKATLLSLAAIGFFSAALIYGVELMLGDRYNAP